MVWADTDLRLRPIAKYVMFCATNRKAALYFPLRSTSALVIAPRCFRLFTIVVYSSPMFREMTRTFRSDRALRWIVFTVAFALRLVVLLEYRDVPYYDRPYSDSEHYHRRAVEIVGGDWLGAQASFLGSPLYPYFVAAIYKPFGISFTLLFLVQVLLGSATCVLIYRLTRALSRDGPYPALLAGLMTAGYGTFAFYDVTVLMTSLEVFLLCAAIVLLVSERSGRMVALVSGALLGLAALGRPNLLLFAPVVFLWLVYRERNRGAARSWRSGTLFAVGCVIAIAPVSIRNYVVARDFVPISSSAGINLYIGNNPDADGHLSLPPGSGLDPSRLYDTSRAIAQEHTGRGDMKPSQVSRYWTGKAIEFIGHSPGAAARLVWKKFALFWNHYEIPNVYNKYYVASRFVPMLRWLFVSFGLIAPLALIGIVLSLRKRDWGSPGGLYAGFVLIYMLSVLPFFVTARYRIAVVPFLIVFAAVAPWRVAGLIRARSVGWLAAVLLVGVGCASWVNRPGSEGSYWLSRSAVGKSYSDLAAEHPEEADGYLDAAVVELKKAAELSPNQMAPRFYLGQVLYQLGCYSAAAQQFDAALSMQPGNNVAEQGRDAAQAAYQTGGDKTDASSLPTTPLERALQYRRAGNNAEAERELLLALESDPQHVRVYNELGFLYASGKQYEKSIEYYRKGLRYAPDNPVLLKNLGFVYVEIKAYGKARKQWEHALELNPSDQSLVQALRQLPAR